MLRHYLYSYFFFNDTATTEIYTLSLHDALPICSCSRRLRRSQRPPEKWGAGTPSGNRLARFLRRQRLPSLVGGDRKSTRLNSSHVEISYAVFCLKKKKKQYQQSYNEKNK